MSNLLTDPEVVQAIGLTTTLSARDQAMVSQIAGAIGPVIEGIVGPVTARSESWVGDGGRVAVALPYRPSSVTTVTEAGSVTTDYYADLRAGIVYGGSRGAPRSFAVGELAIDYKVGSETIPDNIVYAAMEQCRIWWQQGQQSLHAAYGYDEATPSVPMGFAVSTRVRELLEPNLRLPGFA